MEKETPNFTCQQCGKSIPPSEAIEMPVQRGDDPFVPICPDCAMRYFGMTDDEIEERLEIPY